MADEELVPEETVEAPDDIRSAILSAMNEEPAQQETRTRGPDGKFIRAEPEEVLAETAPVAEKTAAPVETTATPIEPKPATGVEPPPMWSEADKTAFKALPAEAQEIVARRQREMEADYTRKTTEIAAFRRDFEPVRDMLAPHMDQIRQAGMTPATLIKNWQTAELELAAGGDRAIGLLRSVIQNYRLDPSAVARAIGVTPGQPAAGVETPPAPNGSSPIQLPPELMSEIQTLKQKQAAQDQYFAQQQQQQQRAAQDRVENTINEFRDAKDTSGKLLHPHYAEVEEDMIYLLTAERARGKEPDLSTLYSKAVLLNTSVQEKVQAEKHAAEQAQRAADAEKAKAEARAKAERARRAGSSVTGAPGSGQARMIQASKEDSRSLREQLESAYQEVAEV